MCHRKSIFLVISWADFRADIIKLIELMEIVIEVLVFFYAFKRFGTELNLCTTWLFDLAILSKKLLIWSNKVFAPWDI